MAVMAILEFLWMKCASFLLAKRSLLGATFSPSTKWADDFLPVSLGSNKPQPNHSALTRRWLLSSWGPWNSFPPPDSLPKTHLRGSCCSSYLPVVGAPQSNSTEPPDGLAIAVITSKGHFCFTDVIAHAAFFSWPTKIKDSILLNFHLNFLEPPTVCYIPS